MMFLMATQPVYASDVWTKATEIMKDVYNQIVLISTVAEKPDLRSEAQKKHLFGKVPCQPGLLWIQF